jgi:thiopeptide-type bacteriocin biosynthesis protein
MGQKVTLRVASRFLLRAPLLPLDFVTGKSRTQELARHELFSAGIELSAPSLFSSLCGKGKRPGKAAMHALANYARRAAFRPTPHGLWAGVAMGTLGPRTAVETGPMRPHLTLSWARLFALGRELLANPEIRAGTRLCVTPSLLRGTEGRSPQVSWLQFGKDNEAHEAHAEVDEVLTAVLDGCASFVSWSEARRALGRVLPHDPVGTSDAPGDPDELDDYLLLLVDDGLLVHDLVPPLVGPPPLDWMRERLGGRVPALEEAAAILRHPTRSLPSKLAALRDSEFPPEHTHAVLVHQPRRATLSAAAVTRAAELAPLLFRMQEALVPPARELFLDSSLGEALDATTEIFGTGAFALGPLAHGEYGARLCSPEASPESAPQSPAPPSTLHALLIERLVSHSRSGASGPELRLRSEELFDVTPLLPTPASFELFLTPCREPRGTRPGTGWMLSVHAPAGATFGRFAEAVGEELVDTLAELAALEREACPGELRLDVAFAPSPALADLATHPAVREKTLALSTWCTAGDVRPAELSLVADPSAPLPLALRQGTIPVSPSPLSRLRSTTAPRGAYRLLQGFSLYRQHAPWALSLGPLLALPELPRVSIDGFVVLPRSWTLPQDLGARSLGRWRKAASVPRRIQVGHEDELLLVDLGDPDASRQLVRLSAGERPRAWEVWPPMDPPVDSGGRRVEAVVAVVDVPSGAVAQERARGISTTAASATVSPPCVKPPPSGWRTFKLFGSADRADRVIQGVIAPVARAALAKSEIDTWFFLRYIDGPGRREHLRFRAHAPSRRGLLALERRLDAALLPARQAGDVVHVESAEYHPERARYGGDAAVRVVEAIFQSESELCCDLFASEEPCDLTEACVLALDGLATGLGLDLLARQELARRQRTALGDPDEAGLDREFRARQRRLHALLEAPPAPFAAHLARLAELPTRPVDVLPSLLHMSANRLAGTDPVDEARATYFWQRALDGLVSRSRAARGSSAPRRRT